MVNKNKNLLLICIFFITCFKSYAGIQNIDVDLQVTYPGASQKMIGDKLVVDLGYLNENQSYTGGNQIEIGTVKVRISQEKTTEDSGCFLEGKELDTVKLNSLKKFAETVSVTDKIYMGNGESIILTAKDINNIQALGDVNLTLDEPLYFVAPECIQEGGFEGEALTSLSYEFKLFADIKNTMGRGTIVGAMAKDQAGVELSIRQLILNQIKSSNTNLYKRRK